jgi:hypothetical protein
MPSSVLKAFQGLARLAEMQSAIGQNAIPSKNATRTCACSRSSGEVECEVPPSDDLRRIKSLLFSAPHSWPLVSTRKTLGGNSAKLHQLCGLYGQRIT